MCIFSGTDTAKKAAPKQSKVVHEPKSSRSHTSKKAVAAVVKPPSSPRRTPLPAKDSGKPKGK